MLATVFGDVHDIGKSLVNTILTNNGYTVVDLGKQVPISTIIDAAKEHDATAIGLSALLVSTSKQMPPCIQELHAQGLEFPVLIGGAAINRDFGLRALYPGGRGVRRRLRARRLLLQGRLRGPGHDGPARRARAPRGARRRRSREAAERLREKGPEPEALPHRRRLRALRGAHRRPDPDAAVLGRARDRRRPRRGLPPPRHARAVQAALGRARREGRGVARSCCARTSSRAWSACGASRTTCTRARCSATSRATREGNDIVVLDPEDRETRARALRLPAPARPRPHLPGRLLPPARSSGELDVVALQAVTVGDEVTELMARARGRRRVRRAAVRARARRADRRGHGRVAARAGPRRARHRRATQGRRYSWGYPACPSSPSTRRSFRAARRAADRHAPHRRLRARARAVDARDRRPPPAGDLLRHEVRLPAQGRAPAPDEVIAGTDRDPTRRGHRCPTRIPAEPIEA